MYLERLDFARFLSITLITLARFNANKLKMKRVSDGGHR